MIDFHIRWMIRKDLEKVVEIENECFDNPWTENDFIRSLRQRNCIGMVAEFEAEEVDGYMVYELSKSTIRVLNFAVHPLLHRNGAGRTMVRKLISKLSKDRRNKLVLDVCEHNLPAQKFFRAMGFLATGISQRCYVNSGGDVDAYRMELPWHPENDGSTPVEELDTAWFLNTGVTQ